MSAAWQPAEVGCSKGARGKLAGVDDLHTLRATTRQQAYVGCLGVPQEARPLYCRLLAAGSCRQLGGKLAGAEDFYTGTLRAATGPSAPFGFWGEALRHTEKLDGTDDLHTPRAATRQPAHVGC